MKSFACVFSLIISSVALGNTLIPLSFPEDMPLGNQPSGRNCVATAFNADDSNHGTCRSVHAGVCSGRVCQPTYTDTVYVVSWDTDGNVLSDQFCGTYVTHQTLLNAWTYAPGFDATTCYLPAHGSPQIAVYDPALGYSSWFGYVTTSTDGAYELLTEGLRGFINQF